MSTSSISTNASTSTPSTDTLHMVRSTDGYAFIVSSPEVDSLKNRLSTPSNSSVESIIFNGNLKLIPRREISKFTRKGYKTLQTLKETDLYVWMCDNDTFKDTVVYEPSLIHHRSTLDNLEEEILQGKLGSISKRMANELLK
ncbi:hypothetical protein [Bacillus pacificus]|uniref:hypothetical protein n=1 Tax=Bacillus pacificus TaxID=2026187 RepID=UPI000789D9E0|nr:hypothetical protein [Bacillus pacificus]MCC2350364.1 hypothetical protein [Bacillus pacificus]MCC2465803.1 hypothetical protein [Bacillus pacificus]MCU5243826.1 hypothetical protein [Bacillus pacificus]MCU5415681.1 hypothetical protein [Bacillus pacificus]MCU5464371.1 hypothetical protein [Bacillus pacificus]